VMSERVDGRFYDSFVRIRQQRAQNWSALVSEWTFSGLVPFVRKTELREDRGPNGTVRRARPEAAARREIKYVSFGNVMKGPNQIPIFIGICGPFGGKANRRRKEFGGFHKLETLRT
jgi:hypothetical protein